MSIIEFIRQPENILFFISIAIMLIMAAVEGLSLLLGISISEAVDNLIPDLGIDADIDVDADVSISVGSSVLDWLNFGRVPFLVLIILFLTVFGLSGFIIQGAIYRLFNTLVPVLFASLIAIVPTIYIVHLLGRIISRIIPGIETTAVKIESLKGKIGEVTLGTATKGNPAEAKVKDRYGKVHYVRVEPCEDNEKFIQGDKVVLVFYENSIFQCEKVDFDI